MTRSGRGGNPVTRALVWLVRGYQTYVSPALPPTCRFYPTCSAYAVEALQEHGVVRGIGLTTWRLLRCAPWHPGGVDMVPPRRVAGQLPDGPLPLGHHPRDGAADHDEEHAPC